MSTAFDHIIIGAGHNGLACAFDLARKGRKVLVLEAAAQAGGAAITRGFAPGFQVSACAHLLHALPDSLISDMGLERHGLRFAARGMATHALAEDGRHLRIDERGVQGAQVSAADQAAYADFKARMARYAKALYPVLGTIPPKLSLDSWFERFAMLGIGLRIRRLGKTGMREFLRIIGMNAYDLLDDNFSSPQLKGALAWDATLGGEYGPRSPGTVLNWLYRLAGESGAGGLGLAQPLGGMSALSAAMVKACSAAGVEIRCNARVARILVEDDHVSGVSLASGQSLMARSVISSADQHSTFMKLLGSSHLDTGFVRRVKHHRSRGLVAKLHLALSGLPAFTGLPAEALGGRLLISPSLDELELAFNPSKYAEIPERPGLEITLPSVNDPGMAPSGQHVLSALVQFVPYELGPDPQAARARLLEAVLKALERHAPGLRGLIIASELLTPLDIEREFGLAGGHWHNGALAFDQFFINRPFPGAHQYHSPLPGLALCGAASHPGGSLMGHAGRNAARQILAGEH